MKSATAEALLPCYREGKRADAQTEKAARVAESEDGLRKKLHEQKYFDDRIIEVVHGITPPENLREKLTSLSARPPGERRRLREQVSQPAILAALAGVLLIIGIIVFFSMERMESFPGREAMRRMIASTNRLSGTEFEATPKPLGELSDWFYMRDFEGFEVAPELAPLTAAGSRIFMQDGHSIAQLAVDEPAAMVYIFRATDFGVQLRAGEAWRVFDHEGWAAAVRRHGNRCSLVALRGSSEEMHDFLDRLIKP